MVDDIFYWFFFSCVAFSSKYREIFLWIEDSVSSVTDCLQGIWCLYDDDDDDGDDDDESK